MQDLNGKVAFVTGGASGIGLAMAKVFGREGMKVMLADIEPAAKCSAPSRCGCDFRKACAVKRSQA